MTEFIEDKYIEAEREQKRPRTQGLQYTGKKYRPAKLRNFLEVLVKNRERESNCDKLLPELDSAYREAETEVGIVRSLSSPVSVWGGRLSHLTPD